MKTFDFPDPIEKPKNENGKIQPTKKDGGGFITGKNSVNKKQTVSKEQSQENEQRMAAFRTAIGRIANEDLGLISNQAPTVGKARAKGITKNEGMMNALLKK